MTNRVQVDEGAQKVAERLGHVGLDDRHQADIQNGQSVRLAVVQLVQGERPTQAKYTGT